MIVKRLPYRLRVRRLFVESLTLMCMHVVITLTLLQIHSPHTHTHTHTPPHTPHTHSPQMEVLKEGYLTQQGSFQVGDIQSVFLECHVVCVYMCKLISAAAQIYCSKRSSPLPCPSKLLL